MSEFLERYQESLLDRVTDSIFSLDTNWRFLYLNEAAEELFGKPASDLLGECIWDLYPEADDSKFYAHYHESMEKQEQISIEVYYEPWDQWYEEHLYPSPDELLAISYEITTKKEYQNQLENERRKFQTLAEEIPEMVYRADPETMETPGFTVVTRTTRPDTGERWIVFRHLSSV